MWTAIKNDWMTFECWVHSWFPGFKTRAMAALGAIGTGADALYHFITGAPPIQWLDQKALAAVSFALFGLSYWFSNMGTRVDNFEAKSA